MVDAESSAEYGLSFPKLFSGFSDVVAGEIVSHSRNYAYCITKGNAFCIILLCIMHFMREMHERLAWARETAGFETATEGASALDVPGPTYLGHENGSRGFKRDSAVNYARRFKVSLEWLLTGKGEPRKGKATAGKTHAVGYIGAGAEVNLVDDFSQGSGLEEVDIPPGVPDDAVVVIVRGDSMYPRYFEGERLFYIQQYQHPKELLNRECVVKVADGRIFVKIIRRGSSDKAFNLESWNTNTPTLEDQIIEWAAPVLARVNKSGS